MLPVRALILDLGEVLVHPQPHDLVLRMADAAGVPLSTFRPAYWAHRNQYDLRGTASAYWDAVLRDSESPLDGAERETVKPILCGLDAASWTVFRDEVWEIAHRFRADGGRTAMLTNCGPEVMDRVRAQRPVGRFFDELIVSWEVGMLKPDVAIYRLAVDRLGVEPASALFVDDRAPNIVGAQSVGLQTLHFIGDESVAVLRERVAGAR